MHNNKIFLTHDECMIHAYNLAKTLMEQGGVKGFVTILNGGMIPAFYIRKTFLMRNIRLPMDMVDVSSYTKENAPGALNMHDLPELADGGDGWVFIDEVCDTGQTVRELREIYPNARFVSLYAKEKGAEVIDIYMKGVKQTDWLVFPWEVTEAEELMKKYNIS